MVNVVAQLELTVVHSIVVMLLGGPDILPLPVANWAHHLSKAEFTKQIKKNYKYELTYSINDNLPS